jgi:nucleotidyltransferase substrate binding protein (TIGR01987 family)
MASKDIRWQQRFQNFEAAFLRLKEAITKDELNELEENGLIQRFEFTVELGWKLLKDYLEQEGLNFKPVPKETIRQAFKSEIITDAQPWIDALELRNNLSHDYSGELFKKSQQTIRQTIYPAIEATYNYFKAMINKDSKNLFDE